MEVSTRHTTSKCSRNASSQPNVLKILQNALVSGQNDGAVGEGLYISSEDEQDTSVVIVSLDFEFIPGDVEVVRLPRIP